MTRRRHSRPAVTRKLNLIGRIFLAVDRVALPLIRPAIRDRVGVDIEVIRSVIQFAKMRTKFFSALFGSCARIIVPQGRAQRALFSDISGLFSSNRRSSGSRP
jgi:hypothetical protein